MDIDQSNSQTSQQEAPAIQLKKAQDNESEAQESVPIVKKSPEDQKKEEERKQEFKQTFMKLLVQLKQGCKKDICANKHCMKNPLKQGLVKFANDKEMMTYAVNLLQTNKAPALLCDDSSSLNGKNLPQANEQRLLGLLSNASAFCTSFSIHHNKNDTNAGEFQTSEDLHISSLQLHQDVLSKPSISFEIDFDALQSYYSNLLKVPTEQKELMQQFRELVEKIQNISKASFSSPEEILLVWRGLVMILPFDQFDDWSWNPLLVVLLKVMVDVIKLAKEETKLFIEFLALTIRKPKFLAMVQRIQSYVTIAIVSNAFESRSIEHALRVLDVFNAANEQRLLKYKIEYREFYNDAINKEVQLKDHIERWIVDTEKAKKANKAFDKYHAFNLCVYPWILDASNKSEIMRYCSKYTKHREMNNSFMNANIMNMLQNNGGALDDLNPYLVLKVHRENIMYDTLQFFNNSNLKLNKQLKVQFIGEQGIDEGGVRKEFFQLLTKELFDPNFGMFYYNQEQGKYWFNGLSHEPNINFELVGLLMGLAVFNQILIDMPFPQACYKKLLGQQITYDDLREWQPEIAKALEFIINYDQETPLEDVLGQTFTIDEEYFGEKTSRDLKMGGSDIYVSKENRDEYIDLYIDYIFNVQCDSQFKSFKKGFYRVCDEEIINTIFKHEELELFVCGIPNLNFQEWKKAARYVDGYEGGTNQVITWFWEILQEMDEDQKKKFLTFTTGCNRAPINGLSSLPLYIGREGPDSDRLPSSHTCFNHLLIPEYTSKDKLRDKIMIAINNSEGFGLM